MGRKRQVGNDEFCIIKIRVISEHKNERTDAVVQQKKDV